MYIWRGGERGRERERDRERLRFKELAHEIIEVAKISKVCWVDRPKAQEEPMLQFKSEGSQPAEFPPAWQGPSLFY